MDLAKLGRPLHLRKHKYVFRGGQLADHVYVLEGGQIKVFRLSLTGRNVVLFFCNPSEVIGINESLLGGGSWRRQTFAQATEDSMLSAVPLDRFKAFVAQRMRVALYIIGMLSYRLNETSEKLSHLAAAHVTSRVARIILHMTSCYGKHAGEKALEMGVPLTQQELADVVGTTRPTVNRIIQTLKTDGIISVTKKYVQVEDEERLRQVAVSDSANSGNEAE